MANNRNYDSGPQGTHGGEALSRMDLALAAVARMRADAVRDIQAAEARYQVLVEQEEAAKVLDPQSQISAAEHLERQGLSSAMTGGCYEIAWLDAWEKQVLNGAEAETHTLATYQEIWLQHQAEATAAQNPTE